MGWRESYLEGCRPSEVPWDAHPEEKLAMADQGIGPRVTIFVDGTGTGTTQKCQCGPECEWPCWQRLGLTEACVECGCPPLDLEEAA